jgi:hypothetical protein
MNTFSFEAFKIRIFNIVLKLATCCLYIAHIISLNIPEYQNGDQNL